MKTKTTNQAAVQTLSQEEVRLVNLFRNLRAWDRRALLILAHSLAWGTAHEKTDAYSWPQYARQMLDLPERGKAA